jgi:hypothetical protein
LTPHCNKPVIFIVWVIMSPKFPPYVSEMKCEELKKSNNLIFIFNFTVVES